MIGHKVRVAFLPGQGELWFTDGSKNQFGTEAGVYGRRQGNQYTVV